VNDNGKGARGRVVNDNGRGRKRVVNEKWEGKYFN